MLVPDFSLEVVLADGRIMHTNGQAKRPKKSSAGYNLTNLVKRLFV
jgi:hypothetical protein